MFNSNSIFLKATIIATNPQNHETQLNLKYLSRETFWNKLYKEHSTPALFLLNLSPHSLSKVYTQPQEVSVLLTFTGKYTRSSNLFFPKNSTGFQLWWSEHLAATHSAENTGKSQMRPTHQPTRGHWATQGVKDENAGQKPPQGNGVTFCGCFSPMAVVPEVEKSREMWLRSQLSLQKPHQSRETGTGVWVSWVTRLESPDPGRRRWSRLSFPSGICQILELLGQEASLLKSKIELLLHWVSTAWTLRWTEGAPGQHGRSSVTASVGWNPSMDGSRTQRAFPFNPSSGQLKPY